MLKALNQEDIIEMLRTNFAGRIGCTDGDAVYIVPVNYVFEDDHILCHSLDGLKIEMMRHHPSICFQLDDIKDLRNWKSIIAMGIYEELYDTSSIENAAKKFTGQNLFRKASLSSAAPDEQDGRDRTAKPLSTPEVFYRIRITSLSGRCEQEV